MPQSASGMTRFGAGVMGWPSTVRPVIDEAETLPDAFDRSRRRRSRGRRARSTVISPPKSETASAPAFACALDESRAAPRPGRPRSRSSRSSRPRGRRSPAEPDRPPGGRHRERDLIRRAGLGDAGEHGGGPGLGLLRGGRRDRDDERDQHGTARREARLTARQGSSRAYRKVDGARSGPPTGARVATSLRRARAPARSPCRSAGRGRATRSRRRA